METLRGGRARRRPPKDPKDIGANPPRMAPALSGIKGTVQSAWAFFYNTKKDPCGASPAPPNQKNGARHDPHRSSSSIAALGAAAFVSSFPLSTVRADTTPTPSLNEPAPTLDFWVESGLTRQRSFSIPQRATMLAITGATTHGGTGVAMPTVTTLWRPPRPAWPAASPISARLPLIHSIASRTTAPALSVGRIGFEASAP